MIPWVVDHPMHLRDDPLFAPDISRGSRIANGVIHFHLDVIAKRELVAGGLHDRG